MSLPVVYISPSKVSEPDGEGYFEVYRNKYWVYLPEKGLAFVRLKGGHLVPQCNSNERIAHHLRRIQETEGMEVTFVPIAFLRHNCEHYR